jgi:hypothetical protein
MGLWKDMREAVLKFRRFDAEWNKLNDAFNAKIKEENTVRRATGRELHSALSIAEQKGNWLDLSDALNAATWWRAKADMLAGVIAAEKAAMEMGHRDTESTPWN